MPSSGGMLPRMPSDSKSRGRQGERTGLATKSFHLHVRECESDSSALALQKTLDMGTKYGVRERSCRFCHRDGFDNGISYTVWYSRAVGLEQRPDKPSAHRDALDRADRG